MADWYSFSFCSRSSLLASACSSDVFTFRRPCYRDERVGKAQAALQGLTHRNPQCGTPGLYRATEATPRGAWAWGGEGLCSQFSPWCRLRVQDRGGVPWKPEKPGKKSVNHGSPAPNSPAPSYSPEAAREPRRRPLRCERVEEEQRPSWRSAHPHWDSYPCRPAHSPIFRDRTRSRALKQ